MPRVASGNFVEECINDIENFKDVVETEISGVTLRDFMIKQKPIIYSAFCTSMVGHQHPRTKSCISWVGDQVDHNVMQSVLSETEEIRPPTAGFSIKEAYVSMKRVHTFAKDPEGPQVANYIALVTKCIWIAQHMMGGAKMSKELDKFYKILTDGKIETTKNFMESLGEKRGDAESALSIYQGLHGRLSSWPNKGALSVLLPKFTVDARLYCVAQRKSSKTTLESLTAKFLRPTVQGREPDDNDRRFYKNCGNDEVKPYWLFFDDIAPTGENLVDTKRFVTIPQFNDLWQISQTTGKRDRDNLLGHTFMKKSWEAMSTIIVLNNPYTGQYTDWVEKNTIRYWSRLAKRDFIRDTKVMQYFLEEIKVRNIKIPRPLCMTFVKFLADISLAVTPAPALEEQPSPEENLQRQKQALQRDIRQDGPSLEARLEQTRVQLAKFPLEPTTDDSGVFLPVLLLGLGIFLLST
jgi:hypothetical protein